jgi:hypothetical protein
MVRHIFNRASGMLSISTKRVKLSFRALEKKGYNY